MKIHEYQAKELLKKVGIPIQDGVIIENESEIESALDTVSKEFNTSQFVIKAQIHAGGRGKGGGVKFSTNREKAIENATENNNACGPHAWGPLSDKSMKFPYDELPKHAPPCSA